MENNEIMEIMPEEVTEVNTEEVIEEPNDSGIGAAGIVALGLAAVGGAIVYDKLVKPGARKLAGWWKNRRAKNPEVVEVEAEDVCEEVSDK